MAISSDRNSIEQQILGNSGLSGKDLEVLKISLATLSEQQLRDKLSELISGNNKMDYAGTILEHSPSVVMFENHDKESFTDEDGNEITEYFDENVIIQRTIKGKDNSETTITFKDGMPFTLVKNIGGNIEKSTFKYNSATEDSDSFITVETLKSNNTKVETKTGLITENGEIIPDFVFSKKTIQPNGTVTSLSIKNLNLKSPTNDKTFFNGECVEETVETFDGKKTSRYYSSSNLEDFKDSRRILEHFENSKNKNENNVIYYDKNNKPVYNHQVHIKKQLEEAYKAQYENRLERKIPLKGTHTNPLNNTVMTIGKEDNVTVRDFITKTLGIDMNSETGKKLADRFVRLPDEALAKISYSDFEVQTLGMGKYAPKINDYSNATFDEIAKDLRLKSGVNLETQDEITQHNIQMQIESKALKQREDELGIATQRQAANLLANMYDNAANMYENAYYQSSNLHKLADLAFGYVTGTDDAGKVRKNREQAEKFRKMAESNPIELKKQFKELFGKNYDEAKVKKVTDNIQNYTNSLREVWHEKYDNDRKTFEEVFKMEYSDDAITALMLPSIEEYCKNDKDFRILYNDAFGINGLKDVEKNINKSAEYDQLGELALAFATMGYGETFTSTKLLNKGTNEVSKTWAGIVQKFAGQKAGNIVGLIPKAINSSAKMTVASYGVNLTNRGDTNSAIQAGIGGAEMGAAGAVVGATFAKGAKVLTDRSLNMLLNDARAMSRYMRVIPKPSEKTANAVSKLFKNGEEVNAQTFMETVIANEGPSAFAKGTGFIAEVAGFESYNIIKQKLANKVDPATGKLPPEWDEIFTINYLQKHFKDEFGNLFECKVVAKLVMFSMGSKNAQNLAIQESLDNSKSLRGIKIREIRTGTQTGYELTMPDGKKTFASNLKQASGYFNYLMQMDTIDDSMEKISKEQVEWRKMKIGDEEVEVAVEKSADGTENIDFSRARKLNAEGEYEQFILTTKSDLLNSKSTATTNPAKNKVPPKINDTFDNIELDFKDIEIEPQNQSQISLLTDFYKFDKTKILGLNPQELTELEQIMSKIEAINLSRQATNKINFSKDVIRKVDSLGRYNGIKYTKENMIHALQVLMSNPEYKELVTQIGGAKYQNVGEYKFQNNKQTISSDTQVQPEKISNDQTQYNSDFEGLADFKIDSNIDKEIKEAEINELKNKFSEDMLRNLDDKSFDFLYYTIRELDGIQTTLTRVQEGKDLDIREQINNLSPKTRKLVVEKLKTSPEYQDFNNAEFHNTDDITHNVEIQQNKFWTAENPDYKAIKSAKTSEDL